MARTQDKILLGILAILLVGMGSVFITALSISNSQEDSKNSNLIVRQATFEEELDDEDEIEDIPIQGSALDQASATALAHIREGRVTDSEIGDEEGYYEIEITTNDGREVDVHLDSNFKILSTEWENEEDDD